MRQPDPPMIDPGDFQVLKGLFQQLAERPSSPAARPQAQACEAEDFAAHRKRLLVELQAREAEVEELRRRIAGLCGSAPVAASARERAPEKPLES
mmetsp:Transcript_56194/g.105560  ORF Transcript_56194/g.105560 Transcript_56194/m.105560 type:complete len:95 (-) Transcript_56194:2-286(-)